MNPGNLLEQFLGRGAAGPLADAARAATDRFLPGGLNPPGGFAGGALTGLAAGGLLGVLLGDKKLGKLAGGVAGYGGAAAMGALALKAWQTWSAGGRDAAVVPAALAGPARPEHLAADGKPFELALMRSMIAAANADGHIGPDEQRVIFEHIGKLDLAADEKAFMFDALSRPAAPDEIAALASGPEQAANLWLVARAAIDPDDPRERAYLDALAFALRLDGETTRALEERVAPALPAFAGPVS